MKNRGGNNPSKKFFKEKILEKQSLRLNKKASTFKRKDFDFNYSDSFEEAK